MTKDEAQTALINHTIVGNRVDDDRGYIIRIETKPLGGVFALVAWKTGVRTEIPIMELTD